MGNIFRIEEETSSGVRIYDENGFGFMISSNPKIVEEQVAVHDTNMILLNKWTIRLKRKVTTINNKQ